MLRQNNALNPHNSVVYQGCGLIFVCPDIFKNAQHGLRAGRVPLLHKRALCGICAPRCVVP
jgi:hypothetical protein